MPSNKKCQILSCDTLVAKERYVHNIYVKLTTDKAATTGINYKELFDCKWNPMTLTYNTLHTPAFKFLYIFWPDDSLHSPKLVAII
jgi:hypothetical protein